MSEGLPDLILKASLGDLIVPDCADLEASDGSTSAAACRAITGLVIELDCGPTTSESGKAFVIPN